MRNLIAFCVLIGGLGAALAADHAPTTVAKIYEDTAKLIPENLATATVKNYPNIRVELRLRATGSVRPISDDTAKFLADYVATKFLPENLASLYSHEIQVAEGTRNVWVPMQQQLVPAFNSELGSGGPIRIWGIVAGFYKGNMILLSTGFETLPANASVP